MNTPSLSPLMPRSSAGLFRPHNILVLAPARPDLENTVADQLPVVSQWLSQFGYVYVARSGQKIMEDDACGVRHMPLHAEALPVFGALDLVVVFHDVELMERVRREYPESLVILVEDAESISRLAQLAAIKFFHSAA